jgi:hypothetical protein
MQKITIGISSCLLGNNVRYDGGHHYPRLRENFIERVFVYRRWKDFLKISTSIKDLVAFHTEHKLLILSHSPKHLSALGKLVAGAKQLDLMLRNHV